MVATASDRERRNVLFIAIDDLRPTLGCYGDQTAMTPGIDRLASQGTVFQHAYCQQAVCSPSRLSLLSGLRPDTIEVWDLQTHFREAMPSVVTLPQHFKQHGYHTQSIGKIFHGGGKPSQDPPSWSVLPKMDVVRDPNLRYATEANRGGKGLKRDATEAADVPDHTYADGLICDDAIATIKDLSLREQPFFLAVGFHKPHLPFCAPQKYWDLYDPAMIPMPLHAEYPDAAPELAVRSWMELEGYRDVPEDGMLTDKQVRHLRHGYYACVSYVDALVGRLLDALVAHQISDRTIVVLWGDHGFHLGEQGLWTKANNYELSTRVPLIVAVPGQKRVGAASDALVELVDLYPTLADACGLPIPESLEGTSMRPLLDHPELAWKQAALSQFPRAREGNRHQRHGDIMGYTLRTQRFRFVQWQAWESKQVVARELYDHQDDPHETRNVANDPQYASTIEELAILLQGGWKAVLPTELTDRAPR